MGLYGNDLMEYMTEAISVDSNGQGHVGAKIKGKEIIIDYKSGQKLDVDGIKKDILPHMKKDLKLLKANFKDVMEEVYSSYEDYVKNTGNEFTPSIKNGLKLSGGRYMYTDGSSFFELYFGSDLLDKDGHTCFVEIDMLNNGIKVSHVSFEG